MSYIYAGAAPFVGDKETKNIGGLYRRTFEADGWEKLETGLPDDVEVRSIEIDPNDSSVVYAGCHSGLYRSKDAGDSWEQLPFADQDLVVWTILVNPANSDEIFVGTAPHAVYRSRDGGASFERLAMPDPSGFVAMSFPCRVIRMTLDPANYTTLYVGIEVGGVVCSLDSGDTWQDCCGELLQLAEQEHLKSRILSATDAEGMMDTHALAVSPARPDGVFLATRMGLFESTDHGQAWREIGIGRFSPLTYARDVIVSPHDAKTLFATFSDEALGQAGSLYRSQDLGESWQRFDHGFEFTSTLMKVSPSPSNAARVVCGARNGQVLGTDDGGQTWKDLSLPERVADVYTVACA
jgi:photosystem II stability/assembly factor-like uncharacterized protein